jgi:hypothetical protein
VSAFVGLGSRSAGHRMDACSRAGADGRDERAQDRHRRLVLLPGQDEWWVSAATSRSSPPNIDELRGRRHNERLDRPGARWGLARHREDALRLSLLRDPAVLFASIRRRCGALRSETPTTRKGEWGVPTFADVAVSTLRASGVGRAYRFDGVRGAGDESRRDRQTRRISTTQTSPTSRERSGCTACGWAPG